MTAPDHQNLIKSLLALQRKVIIPAHGKWSDVEGLTRYAGTTLDGHSDDVEVTTVYSADLIAAYPGLRKKLIDTDAAISRYTDDPAQSGTFTDDVYQVTVTRYRERGEEAYVVSTYDSLEPDPDCRQQFYVTADLKDAVRQYDGFVGEFLRINC